jgi:site-specific recombinase XerD
MKKEVEQFIQWVRMRNPQAKTWRDYQCDMNLFLEVAGRREAAKVRARDVDEFVNVQIARGFKPSTVNRRLAAVASFYAYLNMTDKQFPSPVIPRRHYLPQPQRLPRPVSETDLSLFFNAVGGVQDRAMFMLMLRCGLRIGEVSNLKLDDLYLGEAPARLIVRGKGDRERTVFLSRDAQQALENWLARRRLSSCGYVFVSYQQRRLSSTSISIRMKRIRERCGVHFTAHQLRHTFAAQLLSAGMPITSIQKLLGHRFVETTQNYVLANDRQVQADFHAACGKLEGWSLLAEAEQVPLKEEAKRAFRVDDPVGAIRPVQFDIRGYASLLPYKLCRQLEAYRQLKATRWRAERVIANSRHFYSQHVRMWKFFAGQGVKRVSGLRLEHVLGYVKMRLEGGASAGTVNNDLSTLRSFLAYLRQDDVEVHSSLDGIRRLKQAERLPRYMSAEQVQRVQQKVEAEAENKRPKNGAHDMLLLRAVFYLLWQGGMRLGEVEELKFEDLYVSKFSRGRRLFVRDGKWRKGRVVYLTDAAYDALRKYLRVRGGEDAGGHVFIRQGKPLRKGYVGQRLRIIGRLVDVHVSPHRLRHTFATQLLNVGCRETSIQKLLGHKSLNTTMIYARALERTVMRDYLEAMEIIEGGK